MEEIARAQARIANAQREIASLNAEMATWDAQHAQQDPGAPRLNLATLYGGRPDNDDKIARQQEIVREQQAVIAQQEAVIAALNRQAAAAKGNYLLRNISDADGIQALGLGLYLARVLVAFSS
jgi:hypothetical protein